jgi:hypothetical protein
MKRPVVAVNIEELGTRPLLGLANGRLCSGQLSADFGSGIVQVTGQDGMFGTNYDAGGFESHINPVSAERAFRRGVRFGVKIDRVVRTGLHAGFTSNANGRIELNDAIITLIHCCDGTDAHAGWIRAMIAARHLKATTHIRVGTRFDIFDPGAIHAYWHLILRLARGGTGVTSDALALVDQKSIICHQAKDLFIGLR